MEKKRIINNGKIRIKASELLSKFKYPEDRFNFCREQSKLFLFIF